MAGWTRTARLRTAAVVSVVAASVSIGAFDLRALAEGSGASTDPFALVIGSFATDVLALVAGYGAFRRQRWGVTLLIVVLSFWAVQASVEVVDGDVGLGVVALAVTLGCLWCCLAPDHASTREPPRLEVGSRRDPVA